METTSSDHPVKGAESMEYQSIKNNAVTNVRESQETMIGYDTLARSQQHMKFLYENDISSLKSVTAIAIKGN